MTWRKVRGAGHSGKTKHLPRRRRLLFFCAGTLRCGTITTLSKQARQQRRKSRHPNCPFSTCPSTALTSRQETMNDPTLSWSGVPFLASCRFHCLTASIRKHPQPSVLHPPGGALRHPRLEINAQTSSGALEIEETLVESLRRPPGNGWDFLEIHSTVNSFLFSVFFPFFSCAFLKDNQPEIQKERLNLHTKKKSQLQHQRHHGEKTQNVLGLWFCVSRNGCSSENYSFRMQRAMCCCLETFAKKQKIWKLQNQKKK